MPLKIQNYGEWEGDKPGGHHPPACSCHDCNEGRRTQDTAIGGQRAAAAVRQVEEVLRKPAQPQQVASPKQPLTRPASRALAQRTRAVRRVMAAALQYSVGLHVAGVAALAVYGLIQEGTAGVGPILARAGAAYAGVWPFFG